MRLVPWIVHTKRPRDLYQKFKLVWIRGTSCRDQSWSLQLDFEAKMASSHDGTCPCNLSQGLVPSCVPTVKNKLSVHMSVWLQLSQGLTLWQKQCSWPQTNSSCYAMTINRTAKLWKLLHFPRIHFFSLILLIKLSLCCESFILRFKGCFHDEDSAKWFHRYPNTACSVLCQGTYSGIGDYKYSTTLHVRTYICFEVWQNRFLYFGVVISNLG